MPDRDLHQLTANEIARAVAAGQCSAVDVAQACLDHIAEREPQVGAWEFLEPELVLKQARELDAAGPRGPLHGVPVGIKDIIDTADMPTAYGSPIHAGHRPHMDAVCVALTRRAGGLIMGKTVTTEFANRHPGKTRHPRDPQRTPGGSSSGSGAAVGDCMVPLALGTQTTASTIRPAAFNGCVGYRPTWGDLRMAGVMEAAGSVDTLGIIARSVEDVVLYRDVLIDTTPEPAVEIDPRQLRIGYCRSPFWDQADAATQKHLDACAKHLARAGANVLDVALPRDFEQIESVHRRISSFEFVRNRAWEIDNHWDGISDTLKMGRLKHGLACTFAEYRAARTEAEQLRLLLDDEFADCDVLLTPSAAGEAPVGLNETGTAVFCSIWTTCHVPSLTLPLFTGPNGLPLGAQLVGRRNDDRRLFAAALWVMAQYK
ncbi:MAG: amidase [Betaproteobacteria bacterium]|nr:amidase [Betaproteobacteria bacterium]